MKLIKMSDWFSTLAAGSELSMDAAAELQERGFVVLAGTVLEQLPGARDGHDDGDSLPWRS